MEDRVTEVNRLKGDVNKTVVRLKYIDEERVVLCSETGMFGFDWSGATRVIPESKLFQPHKPETDYGTLSSTVEHEYGATTAEYFNLPELLIVAGCTDGTMHSFKLPSQEEPKTLCEHADVVSKVVGNPLSKDTFCSASWDGTVQLWSIKEGGIDFTTTIEANKPVYDALWLTKDLILIANSTIDKGVVSQADVRAKGISAVFELDNATRAVCRVSENMIATLWDSCQIILIDLRATKERVGAIDTAERARPHAVDTISEGVLILGYDHFAQLWDVKLNKEVWRNKVLEADAVNAVTRLSNSAFAYSTMDGTLSINKIKS
eukprot:TRINITY_DN14087_c0_g1_i2.p1 TRINITY_DN14087_c0_g1~~TRINITY_DN14087_c0_g1_i2.p1  ORF type:complete len:320 (-),score=60.39 TRINITY_DN14087_c0_g1_i2:114-1073(-)